MRKYFHFIVSAVIKMLDASSSSSFLLSPVGSFSSVEAAATIAALRVKLRELEDKRNEIKQAEEETLKRLFEEAGGTADLLEPGVKLSEKAMAGLIRGTEGERNLENFRRRAAASSYAADSIKDGINNSDTL